MRNRASWLLWTIAIAGIAALQLATPSSPRAAHANDSVPFPQLAGAETSLAELPVPWDATPALAVIRGAWDNARTTSYQAITHVDESTGTYQFDCSGFAQWVLKQSHPEAARWVARGLPHRPLARNFQSRIAKIAADKPRGGWARIERVAEIQPGDVLAWVKPREIKSVNTGHVVFAMLPPRPLTPGSNTYLLRVADATRLWHVDDTRNWRGNTANRRVPVGLDTADESPNDQGLGFGTMSIVADPTTGRPTAYGWVATEWRTFDTQIAIGRPLR